MEIFRQLLEGVRYIHSEDVLHRDLKVRFAFTVTGLQFIGVFFFLFFFLWLRLDKNRSHHAIEVSL